MNISTKISVPLLMLFFGQALADPPKHFLPQTNEIQILIYRKCANLDAALTAPGASDRCSSQMLAEFKDIELLARDPTIPDPIWIGCRQDSGSMQTANFGLWAKCLRVTKVGCSLQKEYGGIGITTQMKGSDVIIANSLAGSPAQKAGLVSGDILVKVGDEPIPSLSPERALERLRGQPGTQVTLTVRSKNEQVRTVTLTRYRVTIPNTNPLALVTCLQMIQSGNWVYNRNIK